MMDMDRGRADNCTGALLCSGGEGDDSSSYCDDSYSTEEVEKSERGPPCRRTPSAPLSFLRGRISVLSCIIIFFALGGVGNQGVGLSTAGITLPVTRKFSQMKGSGRAEGESGGMTAEHVQQLRDHDYQRHLRLHGRILTSTTVADFPLWGSDDLGFDLYLRQEYGRGCTGLMLANLKDSPHKGPRKRTSHRISYPFFSSFNWLYYTEIELGTPSNTYYVQVDTGSELLWVNCQPCPDCPSSSTLGIPLRLYNPSTSSTSSNISCSSDMCRDTGVIADKACVDNSCQYQLLYGDQSTSEGYLVEDTITYETGVESNSSKSQYVTASAQVTFGCGFNQTGDTLTSSSRATDGIMGFGQEGLSVVTQLASQGLTTNVFAHCLQGDTGEGGIFVIGDIQEPGIVYTGIVQDQVHYNVVLQSISMNGVELDIPPAAFDTNPRSGDSGTIFDSGTTFALFVDEAYDAFMTQLLAILATKNIEPTYPTSQQGAACFNQDDSTLSTVFPNVTLQFEGAAMNLVPTNYLYSASDDVWCVGWSKSSASNLEGLTILGDIVLKNKLVVYDLRKEQIGWADYDCLSGVAVSNGTSAQMLNPIDTSSSYPLEAYRSPAVSIYAAVLTCAAIFLYNIDFFQES